MRVAPPVVIDSSQKAVLEQWARRSLPARQVERARWCCWLRRARLIWRLQPSFASAITSGAVAVLEIRLSWT